MAFHLSLFPLPVSLGRLATLLVLAALLAGCAARGAPLPMPAWETLPAGSPLRSETLAEGDAWLRHHLMYGEAARGLEVVRGSRAAPDDRLVRALQEALLLREAGDYAGSNEALAWAEAEADRRWTRSVSRAAASLAVNDAVMAYTPTAAELVMIPYYRILNHLALGDREGALVEARKAGALVERLAHDAAERCQLDAMLLYLAGVVQSDEGERNDALVSLRQAERAFAGCGAAPPAVGADLYRAADALGVRAVADSAAQRYAFAAAPARPGSAGDLLVLLEEGFVAHRASQALHLPIFPGDVEGLDRDDSDGVLGAASVISARLLDDAVERAAWGGSWNDHRLVQWGQALDGAYILRLAWPVVRREPLRPAALRVLVDDSVAAVHPLGDVSAVVEREIAADRPAMLARLVARGLVKYLVTRELEEKAEEEGGEVLGFLAGRLGNLAANELERADTRGWSLLPDRVAMARLRLPPGRHRVRLETLGANGEVVTSREIGPVEISAGETAVVSERVWAGNRGLRIKD